MPIMMLIIIPITPTQLQLCINSSPELLAERLRYAITHCTEMDADFKLTDTDVAGWGLPTQQPTWTAMANND